jgi:hypothetical protein
LQLLPKDAIGAEIGVWRGEFSRRILEIVHPQELHLIDPWAFQPSYPNRWYGGGLAQTPNEMDQIYADVVRDLGSDPAVRIHRGFSHQVVDEFPDAYFDWVYVDGNHSYEFVRKDLLRYWPKIRAGGLLAGDDYRKDVKRAVDEFTEELGTVKMKILRGNFILRKP